MSAGQTEAAPAELYRIFGKHRTQRNFQAMDLKEGTCVGNLIYASLLTQEEVMRFMNREAPRNPEWTLEPRPVGHSSTQE